MTPLATGLLSLVAVGGLVLADSPAAYSVNTPVAGAFNPTLSAPAGTNLRILVVGDSLGITLGIDLSLSDVEARNHDFVDDKAIIGCGLAIASSELEHGEVKIVASQCDPRTPSAQQWPALLAADISRSHPDVVLLTAGRFEVTTRRSTQDGPWVDITEPADAAYIRNQLLLADSIATAGGAQLAVTTAPCFSSGETPDGGTWPEDQPNRVSAYNAIVRSVAASDPRHVKVVDLGAMVCPDGHYRESIDGVIVRAPDGIHLPYFSEAAPNSPAPDSLAQADAFGAWITPRILAQITG